MSSFIQPPPFISCLNKSSLSKDVCVAIPMSEPTKEMVPVDYAECKTTVTYNSAKIDPVGTAYGWGRNFLDSSGDFIDFGSVNYLTSGEPFTISVIISPGSTASNDCICKIKTNNTYGFYFMVSSLAGYGPLCFGFNGFGRVRVDDGSLLAILQNGLPHKAVLTYNGGTAGAAASYRCLVDGVEYPMTTSSSLGNPTNENTIGGQTSGNPYDGKAQNLVIWNRELQDEDIARHFFDPYMIYRDYSVIEWLAGSITPPTPSGTIIPKILHQTRLRRVA